jgi:hypothetical protein
MRKALSTARTAVSAAVEKKAIDLLIAKMGISRKEAQDIFKRYDVSAAQLIELMQLSKYEFVHEEKPTPACAPCTLSGVRVLRMPQFEMGRRLRG